MYNNPEQLSDMYQLKLQKNFITKKWNNNCKKQIQLVCIAEIYGNETTTDVIDGFTDVDQNVISEGCNHQLIFVNNKPMNKRGSKWRTRPTTPQKIFQHS